MAVNWGLLQQPDIAGNALQAFNTGQEQGRQNALRNALTAYAQDPSQISQVIAADPATGIQLQRQNEEAKQRAAADLRTEDAATREQHRVSTVRFLQALRAVPPEQRAQRAQELFQQNEMGWTPEQVWQNASLLAQNPQRLTDEGLNSALAVVGGEVQQQRRGAHVVGNTLVDDNGQVLFENPNPTITPYGIIPGAPRPGQPNVAAPPAQEQPGQPAPRRNVATANPEMMTVIQRATGPLNPTPTEMEYLARTSGVEAGGRVNPGSNGSSQGPFQFHPETFQRILPGGNINNPDDQARAALLLARESERALYGILGREPTAAELYIMHQQGAGGGPALFRAPPETNAVDALTPAYGGNRNLATQAIVNNGGNPNMTAGQFLDYWRQRYGGGQTANQTAPQPAPEGMDVGNGRRLLPLPETPAQRRQAQLDAERLALARHAEERQSRTGRPLTAQERTQYPGAAFMRPDGTPGYAPTNGQQTPRQQRQQAAALRQQFNSLPDVREFEQVQTSYEAITRIAGQTPTAASDLSLIYSYMRMLDPGSVVREGEFATAQNAAGIPDQVRNAYNRAINGQRLNGTQRQQFTATARDLYQTRRERYDQRVEEYQGYARDYELNPLDVIRPRPVPGAGRRAQGSGSFSGANASGSTGSRGTTTASTSARPARTQQARSPLAQGGRPLTPEQASRLPPGARFITTDGREMVRQ